jgi:flagellar basal body-associated protein FliL
MKKSLVLAAVLMVLTATALPRVVYADDAAPAASSDDAAKKDEAPEAKKPEGEGGEGKKAPADVSGGRFAGDPVYVHLNPMILPVITDAGAEQIVTLQITIQVKDFDAADAVHSNMPKVMDALMRALYGGLGNGNLRNGQLIDVSKVKNKAIAAVGQAIGPKNVRDVLIEAVAQRKL